MSAPVRSESLHLFVSEWEGTGDYVIARDLDDAKRVLVENTDEETLAEGDRTWKQWPDDEVFPAVYVDEPGHPTETRTAQQICRDHGRGLWGGYA
jgi:hypothetical protein